MEPEKPHKKIVSKSEFAAAMGVKAALSSLGIGSLVAGVVSAGVAVIMVLGLFMGINVNAIGALSLLIFGGGALVLLRLGRRAVKEAHDREAGIPLTEANTADLPASDSLVRASEEPLQAQQAELLRAASGSQEQHEEQLLRASASREP